MTLNADVKAINCTSCGAGLDVLGGGRVTTHICPYCGTELDAVDNYKALRRFNDQPRPETPFPIGTKGVIDGVDYQVIGLLEHEERWNGQVWRWLDHQLYSPLHGYAWLTLEQGQCTFSRRYRRPVWLSGANVERANHRPSVSDLGERLNYFDTTRSTICYAEGEFSWRPQKDDTTTTVSVLAEHRMLSFSETGAEREVYQTCYLSAKEIHAGFGFDAGLRPRGVHPLQPFSTGVNTAFLKRASLIFAILCLVLTGVFAGMNGRTLVHDQEIARTDLPVVLPLEGIAANELVHLRVVGNGVNSWSALELEATDPEDELLFSTTRTVERYQGRDSDGNWSEGSNRAVARFRAPLSGTYQLTLGIDEEEQWLSTPGAPARQWTRIWVTAQTGRSVWGWTAVLAVIFALVGGLPWWRQMRHNKARWAGSDWSDED